ncbi:MAG: hypothetical protein ACE5GX_09725 [Thermoanaerobaculia bacterium]
MLESSGHAAETERSSRSEPLTEEEAQGLLSEVSRTLVCRGRKTVELGEGDATTADLKGPTGSFRAPMLRVDDTLVVGFNREAIAALFR